MFPKTHYEVLAVPVTATQAQIEEGYVWLTTDYLPGKAHELTKGQLTTTLNDVNEAYEVLSNPAQRAGYDEKLITEMRQTLGAVDLVQIPGSVYKLPSATYCKVVLLIRDNYKMQAIKEIRAIFDNIETREAHQLVLAIAAALANGMD